MNPRFVLWVLIALGALWTIAGALVLLRSGPGPSFEAIEEVEAGSGSDCYLRSPPSS